ncbi:hypothetical protein FBQ97_00045 [Acidobacteria bacterium ACD]|nr:MAG: hypothetical protein EDX89_05505 [Acidobacteriota bacterium]MCE7956471.1 hypothetical protein [Acidobacteria bacterium ACB2]MDL1948195.1 hypothetical protein [Acidobacteria bacterium ACD]
MARLGLYQPFIEDRNVRRLYRLKIWLLESQGRRVPMTTLVNRILDDFFDADGRLGTGEDRWESDHLDDVTTAPPP